MYAKDTRISLIKWAAILAAVVLLSLTPAHAEENQGAHDLLGPSRQGVGAGPFVDEFMRRNPDIEVTLDGAPSAEYNAKAALMFRSGTPFDVMYIRDARPVAMGRKWLGAGRSIHVRESREAKQDMLPLAKEMQSYKGKLYGLHLLRDNPSHHHQQTHDEGGRVQRTAADLRRMDRAGPAR